MRRSIQAAHDLEFKKKKERKKRQWVADLDERDGKKQKQADLAGSFAKQEKRIVDCAIGQFFYVHGIASNAANSVEFHDMVRELKNARSAYKAPHDDKLRTTIL